jgi:predicted metalloprotease
MDAAEKIGDDYLQKKARGYAVPDSFTHGTSQQRMQWFNTGMKSGDINSCDTFK